MVGAGLARRCEIQLAYSIGVAEPISINVDTFGTGELKDAELAKIVKQEFPTKPRAIIEHLDLLRPIYRKTAAYGHFGREDEDFTWERLDKVVDLSGFLKERELQAVSP